MTCGYECSHCSNYTCVRRINNEMSQQILRDSEKLLQVQTNLIQIAADNKIRLEDNVKMQELITRTEKYLQLLKERYTLEEL